MTARTPDGMTYEERGRYPEFINIYVRCSVYWFKVVNLPLNWLPRKILMLLNMHSNDKIIWVNNITLVLYQYGFGFVWECQDGEC